MREIVHGTLSGYTNTRCRCADCRCAMADYMAAHRAERTRNPELIRQHGKWTSYNQGCRCAECTYAWRLYCRERQVQRA